MAKKQKKKKLPLGTDFRLEKLLERGIKPENLKEELIKEDPNYEIYRNNPKLDELIKKQTQIHSKVSISDLDASLIEKNVVVEGRVSGEITQLALVDIVECQECYDRIPVNPYDAIFGIRVRCDCGNKRAFKKIHYKDYSIIFLQTLLEQIPKFDKRFYTPKKIYVVGCKVPAVKKLRIEGKVIVVPKKNEICILAKKVEPIETEIENFVITEEDKENWIKYFKNGNSETLRWQIAPDMVGRSLVQESRLLVLHSPPIIKDINGKKIRGYLREVLFGDTKCYKSESMLDITCKHYHFGDYIVAESSSRTGITYTIDNDLKTITWGVLALNDLGYLALDGLHSIFSEEMKELREALESGRIIVRRSQSGDALARTRITAALNPGIHKNKPMNQYLFKCMALKDTYAFRNEPDVTRWDIFISFALSDVDKALIVERKPKERPIPDVPFIRHIYWGWSRKEDQIEYTKKTKELIIDYSKEIMEKYSVASLPVVHNGFRDVLTRISVAVATKNHSTDDTHEKIIVRDVDVKEAVNFYQKMLGHLQLEDYKLAEEGKLEITENEFKEIVQALDNLDYRILESIKFEPKTSSILSEELEISTRTIKGHYSKLAKFWLIQTKAGVGISLRPRGIKFLHLLSSKGEVVKKSFTNDKESEESLHRFTNKLKGHDKKSGSKKVSNTQDIGEIVKQDFTNEDENKTIEETLRKQPGLKEVVEKRKKKASKKKKKKNF